MIPRRLIPLFHCVVLAWLVSAGVAPARGDNRVPEIWFAPPNNVMTKNRDFPGFFESPNSWHDIAPGVAVFSVSANYLLRAPKRQVRSLLRILEKNRIKLDVAVPALPVDKRVCGNGVEGMVWPGEPRLYSRRLKTLGVNVFSFSLDEPLTYGHIYKGKHACHLEVREVARLLARSVHGLRSEYPSARIVDDEVPTGMPTGRWLRMLSQWLTDFKRYSGTEFYGLTMDVYWPGDWRATVQATTPVLHTFGVRAGIFLNASDHMVNAEQWIRHAKTNVCRLRSQHDSISYVVFANWNMPEVSDLPSGNPTTLSGLVDWYEHGPKCSD